VPDPAAVRGRLWLSAFGLGYLRPGPGTWTSIATALAIGAAEYGADAGLAAAAGLAVLGSVVTLAFGTIRMGERAHADPSWVVSDEVAGQAIATAGALLHGPSPLGLAVALVAFRVFDIAKPGPIHRLQHLPGGVGVLADDVAAGVIAGLLAFGAAALLPGTTG
jgi:phosphatidylglycerophosphatase A